MITKRTHVSVLHETVSTALITLLKETNVILSVAFSEINILQGPEFWLTRMNVSETCQNAVMHQLLHTWQK